MIIFVGIPSLIIAMFETLALVSNLNSALLVLNALGIALIFALIFVVYYLNKSIRLLKGGTGWKLLTIGVSLYVPRVILSCFMVPTAILSEVEAVRISLSGAIILFITLGMWKLSTDLKKVNICIETLYFYPFIGDKEKKEKGRKKGADRYITKNENLAAQCNELARVIHDLAKGEK
jgi:hypothetical protein